MNIELIAYTPDPEAVIEKCGRTCYHSPEKDAEHRAKFLQGIIHAGHTSVIEHATATFRISDVSRALTHQLVRHRLFSFSQQSQRYVKEDAPNYYIPKIIDCNFENADDNVTAKLITAQRIYNDFMKHAWSTYKTLIELGFKKEDARFVLPNAAKTEICVTGNFREWYNFLKLRCDIHAQYEIRCMAFEILKQLCEIAPNIFNELRVYITAQLAEDGMINRAKELNEECNISKLTSEQKIEINKKIENNTQHDINLIMNDEYEEKHPSNAFGLGKSFSYPTIVQTANTLISDINDNSAAYKELIKNG